MCNVLCFHNVFRGAVWMWQFYVFVVVWWFFRIKVFHYALSWTDMNYQWSCSDPCIDNIDNMIGCRVTDQEHRSRLSLVTSGPHQERVQIYFDFWQRHAAIGWLNCQFYQQCVNDRRKLFTSGSSDGDVEVLPRSCLNTLLLSWAQVWAGARISQHLGHTSQPRSHHTLTTSTSQPSQLHLNLNFTTQHPEMKILNPWTISKLLKTDTQLDNWGVAWYLKLSQKHY